MCMESELLATECKPWPSWKKLVCRELYNITVCQLVYCENVCCFTFNLYSFRRGIGKGSRTAAVKPCKRHDACEQL